MEYLIANICSVLTNLEHSFTYHFVSLKNTFLDFILPLGFPLSSPLEDSINSGIVITS